MLLACGGGDDYDEEHKAGRGGAVRGTTYLAGGSRKLAALKVPRQSPMVVLVKIRDD
jgi:hypothetical protein